MDAVISALERSLSQTHEPRLRQQLTDTIRRLRTSKGRDGRVRPRGDGSRGFPPSERRSSRRSGG
jgi:hypothetical protein